MNQVQGAIDANRDARDALVEAERQVRIGQVQSEESPKAEALSNLRERRDRHELTEEQLRAEEDKLIGRPSKRRRRRWWPFK